MIWNMLAALVREKLSDAWGEDSAKIQSYLLETAATWWPERSAHPTSLIHNDFNPRNITFENCESEACIRIYDWELATLGPPQHDVAEFMCTTLQANATKADTDDFLAFYRETLEEFSRYEISEEQNVAAFASSLGYLLINRLSMYALLSRALPAESLSGIEIERTLKNWKTLYEWYGNLS